ncbi:hypothetical protein SEA_SPOOKY_93 [Gordonia phage Spooky]|nr:hypothetical protein SEA_SPOOKY_93 [Gordonia phage Spooky]
MTDQTMRDVLTVYRTDVNELEADVERWRNLAEWRDSEVRNGQQEIAGLKEAIAKCRNINADQSEKISKLNTVIESLKLELATEREAHTKLRDQAAGDSQ